MASVDECREALHELASRLDENADAGNKVDLDRTLATRITDLSVAFHCRLTGGRLIDITDGDDPKAKIVLVTSSDDLVAMIDGREEITRLLAARRISIRANPFDLLKLRKLL